MGRENYQRVGLGRHGGGNGFGIPRKGGLLYDTDEINTLLTHVKSVQYITKNLTKVKEDLEKALDDFANKGDAIDKVSEDTRQSVFQLVEYLRQFESRIAAMENNITNVVEPDNTGLVPSDVIARYISSYTSQFANEDQLGALDFALTELSSTVNNLSTALNNAVMRSLMATPGGIATLGTDGKIPASQLPSTFVDGIVECYLYNDEFYRPLVNGKIKPNATSSDFTEETLVTPDEHHMYTDVTTHKVYRWGGTAYAEIQASPGSTDDVAEGSSNLYFTTERVNELLDPHTENSDIHVTLAQKTEWSGKYKKPAGGIPSTDLSTLVNNSLEKANSALQKACQVIDIEMLSLYEGSLPNVQYKKTDAIIYNLLSGLYEGGAIPVLKFSLLAHTSSFMVPLIYKINDEFIGYALNSNGKFVVEVHVNDNEENNVTVITTAFYTKPNDGIPMNDLEQNVKKKLGSLRGYYASVNDLPTSGGMGDMAFVQTTAQHCVPVWWNYNKWVDSNGVQVTPPVPQPEPDYYYYSEIGNDDTSINHSVEIDDDNI